MVAVAVAFTATAHAEDKERAREAFRAASQHYDFGEYQQALDAFKEAYKNYEDPSFLFNIAQCHRALGDKQEAITFYKSYLRKAPDAPNRADVKRTIAELESAIERDKPQPSPAEATPPPAPSSAADPAAARSSTTAATLTTATPPDKAPRKRILIWSIVGGVAAAALAVGLGVGLGTQSHPPKATYGTVRF